AGPPPRPRGASGKVPPHRPKERERRREPQRLRRRVLRRPPERGAEARVVTLEQLEPPGLRPALKLRLDSFGKLAEGRRVTAAEGFRLSRSLEALPRVLADRLE